MLRTLVLKTSRRSLTTNTRLVYSQQNHCHLPSIGRVLLLVSTQRQKQQLCSARQIIRRPCSTLPQHTTNTVVDADADDEYMYAQVSSFQTTRDKYGRHRRLTPTCANNQHADATSKALLAEYRIESNLAMTRIEQKFVDRFGVDRSVLVREIQDAAAMQSQGPETAEIGPSGLYKYYSEDNGAGMQVFKRIPFRKISAEGIENGDHQEVIKMNHQTELPGPMCLSVDEEYVARISTPSLFGGNSQLIMRNIDSGYEDTMSIPNLHNIAVGPCYMAEDGEREYHIYFSTTNESGRPDSVYRVSFSPHDGFGSSSEPELLLHDNNESNHVDVSISKGKQWMIIQSTSKSSNEVHLIGPPTDCAASPILVRERQDGVLYYVECGVLNEDVFILAHAMKGRLNSADDRSILGEEMTLFQTRMQDMPLGSFDRCQVVATSDESHFIEELDVFGDYIALYERSLCDGTQRIRTIDRDSSDLDEASTGTIVPHYDRGLDHYATITPGGNAWYQSTSLVFGTETPVEPATMYTFDMKQKSMTRNVGNRQGNEIVYSRVFATSLDGTNVPMTLVGKKDAAADINGVQTDMLYGKKRPAVLIAYGCYGETNKMLYEPTIAPLVNRGFVVAYAHTRGGGELGRSWYQRGRGYEKERAIEDYLACAEVLVGDLCIAGKLAARGFSAGGVIVAAAVNRSPQLFSAMTLINSFLDVYGSMVDPSLPLTEHEYDEWGDALTDEISEETIKRYCPFANIRPQVYPPTLLVGTLDDNYVPYWHSSTYAVKRKEMMIQLREDAVDDQRTSVTESNDDVLLYIEEQGGHNLHSRRLDVASLECAFLLGQLSSSNASNTDGKDRKKSSLLGAFWSMVK